jgi:FkbM family methyltransferase
MTGATGNIYCGLHEFHDMAFVLHCLRRDDLFVDIGANIGSYTILASGVAGARTICAEPVPKTFEHLCDNIRLNNLEGRVSAKNVAVGSSAGTLHFTSGLDTVNHVARAEDKNCETVPVPVVPLDDLLGGEVPVLMKVDVEGFETEVVRGGQATLHSPKLQAILMELNGSGARYGYDDQELHRKILELGFRTVAYDPFTRKLAPTETGGDNALYVRNLEEMNVRLAAGPRIRVNGVEF